MNKEDLKNCLEYLDGVGMIQTASCYTCKQLVQQFIHYSACKDKTPKVGNNEKAKEYFCEINERDCNFIVVKTRCKNTEHCQHKQKCG